MPSPHRVPAVIQSHFLCQPIRPAWSKTAFLASKELLKTGVWSAQTSEADLLSPEQVKAESNSQSLVFLQKLWERTTNLQKRSAIILQMGRTQGSISLLKELGQSRLSEEEILALIEALARHPDPQQLVILKELYRRYWANPRYQHEILLAVGRTQSEAGLLFLKEIYQSAWHQIEYRQIVIRALGLHAQAEAVHMLLQISRRYAQDLKIQRAVIKALGYSHCAASANILQQMLADYPQTEMRHLIWRALAATASDTAVEILRSKLKQSLPIQERKVLEHALKHAYREVAI